MIAASVIIAFSWNISGESVLVAIYLHGLLNVAIGVILNDFVGKAEIRKSSQGAVLVMSAEYMRRNTSGLRLAR